MTSDTFMASFGSFLTFITSIACDAASIGGGGDDDDNAADAPMDVPQWVIWGPNLTSFRIKKGFRLHSAK